MQKVSAIVAVLLLLLGFSTASPIFETLFGSYNQPSHDYRVSHYPSHQHYPTYQNYPNYNSYQTSTTKKRAQKEGRSYKEICRAINPAPYAFPGKAPFPAVPVC